ncbi:MAG: DEAD/DEAH box helicase family protein [Acidobacteria bacterium]|uniref:DEAD/DEAH box helicase family protein n=1 Tax=Candidatus Polarisedimenticola svalbardensis TaxID=2886004 RepID=A0A8J6XUS4_9BACT|nr:DEAD/DEAH box helicase family protein [Candidatus Polarisedimenticola svalbardensis]
MPLPPADPILLNLDLERWAGAAIARTGRKYALLGRVESLRLTPDGSGVMAEVRGNRSAPHAVEIAIRNGVVEHLCTCSQEDGQACRHAVAALEALRFPMMTATEDEARGRRRKHAGRRARGEGRIVQKAPSQPGFVILGGEDRTLTREERVSLAIQTEIRERKHRARMEKKDVRPLPSDGMPPRFQVGRKGSHSSYEVVLRGEKGVHGNCTCPDYQKNELGTCKHIERVRQWYSRKKKDWPQRTLSLFYSPRVWMQGTPEPAQEVRMVLPPGAAPGDLVSWFGEDGWIRPAPDDMPVATWIRQALEAVRRAAGENGWNLDLTPDLLQRTDQAAPILATAGEPYPTPGGAGDWDQLISRLNITLHPYQEVGVRFLAGTTRALLADDMGLGKTVQAVAAALLLRKTRGVRKCLVVCPASLKHQWRDEIDKVCGERAEVVDGRKSGRLASYESWRSRFLVINYELVLRDLDLLRAAGPDLVILDEAQRIKNWETKTARAMKRLRSPYAFILTGTPLENRLTELHSLVEFLHPRALGPRWRLLPFHAVTDQEDRIVAYEDLELLRARLKPFFLRRERSMVLDQLPDRTDNTFWIDMTPAQMRPYRRLAAKIARLLAGGGVLGAMEGRILLQTLTSMRILCNGLAQYSWARFEDMIGAARPGEEPDIAALHSPKLQEFVDVLEEILDGSTVKVVVFSQWERMLRLTRYAMGGLLGRRGERTEIFHGGLNSTARSKLLDRFREDSRFRVLLSTDAGGLGLNFQDVASVVVNLEVPWNPAILEQRIARVHRMGQRRNVHVLNFVTRGALEERVRRVVDSKRALFDGLLVEGADQVRFDSRGKASFVEQVRDLISAD